MDVADLRLLDAVATEGSFSAAAARLRFSQPSVSARVAAVERSVGAELFVRDSRGARLTPAGVRYLSYVRRCIALLDSANRAVQSEVNTGSLRVGVPSSYAPAVAHPIIAAGRSLGMPTFLRSGHSTGLRSELLDDLLDIVLTVPGPVAVGYESRHATDTAVVAVAEPGFRLSASTCYAIHTWGQDDAAVSELLAQGVPHTQISLVSPASAAVHLAVWKGYAAVVPELCTRQELRQGTLQRIRLHVPGLSARLDWTYSARHPRRKSIEDIIRSVNAELG